MNQTLLIGLIALAGVVSAALYLRRRQWLDALLVVVATTALGLFAADLRVPGEAGRTLAVDPNAPPLSLEGVNALRLEGDGLRAAAWNDLPALPLAWQAPKGGALRLDFPSQVALGRLFTLKVEREDKTEIKKEIQEEIRLELLAENGQPIAQARGAGNLTVEWMPPVAERVVLKARLLGAKDKVIAEGPVPFTVHEPVQLQVVGRFGAPSFDLRVLNDLLAGSGALLDWQVTLGRDITRLEQPREEMTAPNLMVIDAARFERMGGAERTALLERVAAGMPLLVLGGNANDPGVWSRTLQLPLRVQPLGGKLEAPLEMPLAPMLPTAREAGPWLGADDMVWTRDWKKGRIAWLGVSEWHRHAIAEPRKLALWWQGVLDRVGVERRQETEWLAGAEMPLPGQRLEVCARGVEGEVAFPELKQALRWQARADRADASCVALWPQKSGWLQIADRKAGAHAVYVYAENDWPQWQAMQKRDATARYAARSPLGAQEGPTRPMPAWPFALAFASAMLLLWWRERR
ncbi:hypothetical protein [Massilia timonae]|uniref:hypothetical protein n=1 Tax=Massilia timonae TaxID=47229 RepID=UPI00289C7821|nr:hypothetical protein [Massilia timonae]